MSSDRHYPELNEATIDVIARIYEADPGYFEDPRCPYTKGTKEVFKGRRKYSDFDSHNLNEMPDSDDLVSQVNHLRKELHEYGQSISGNSESSASDKNTYFRLSVTLLEKLVDLQERTVKITEYEKFQGVVLDVMEKELSPDQRQVMLTRMQGLIQEKTETNGSKDNGSITSQA